MAYRKNQTFNDRKKIKMARFDKKNLYNSYPHCYLFVLFQKVTTGRHS